MFNIGGCACSAVYVASHAVNIIASSPGTRIFTAFQCCMLKAGRPGAGSQCYLNDVCHGQTFIVRLYTLLSMVDVTMAFTPRPFCFLTCNIGNGPRVEIDMSVSYSYRMGPILYWPFEGAV